ncbi:two-component system, OmpR family, response regulator VicR [Ruminococcaceae bacterium YRB3002]|nr:two-component system, OmpR family, response regulator VicR [Ruminococcaceae bacterium YRB3002]
MAKILIVDDDPSIVTTTADTMSSYSFDMLTATDGREGFKLAVSEHPDVIILDWMMPNYNGLQFMQDYRAQGYTTPIICLTAKGDLPEYKVEALRDGADSYINKPYNVSVLIETVRSLLRRAGYDVESAAKSGPSSNRHIYSDGELIIDCDAMQAFKYEESCNLTNREFQLLQYLEDNKGRVCARAELLQQVWKYDFLGDERTVDVTIKRTRQKIEPDQKNFKYILTRRGFGYFFPKDLT